VEFSAYIEERIGEIFAGFVYLFVGVRLYALSRRNGQIPDRLLSASFLLWAVSYAVYDIPELISYREVSLPAVFTFSSLFTLYLGTATFALFTRAVFRSRERWASGLVACTFGCLIVGLTGSVWVGDWGGEAPLSNPWWWVARVGTALPLCWMGVEGVTQYVKARQRRRLDLCAPLVCNRYLLWGLAGGLWAILEFIDVAQYIAYERTGHWSHSLIALVSWYEFVPGLLIGLVFFPPAFYQRWITGTAPAEQVAG
jgi:hypothetical protein